MRIRKCYVYLSGIYYPNADNHLSDTQSKSMRSTQVTRLNQAILVSMDAFDVESQRLKFVISFHPFRFAWISNKEVVSKKFSTITKTSINSIEVGESLLNNQSFLVEMKAAYSYLTQYRAHTYFGFCDLLKHNDQEYAFVAKYKSGINALLKDEIEVEIISANSDVFVSDSVRSKVKLQYIEEIENLKNKLSERELQILGLLGSGMTVKQAASETYLSTHTIESHKQNIYKKLEIRTMAELGRMAERLLPEL